jgi:hypothetical protein
MAAAGVRSIDAKYARSEGLKCIQRQVLGENMTTLAMCRQLGVRIESDPQEQDVDVVTPALE